MSILNLPAELAERLSPLGQRIAADIIDREAREHRVVVTRKEAARMLGIKQTRVIKLEPTGAVGSILERHGATQFLSLEAKAQRLLSRRLSVA